MTDRQIPGSSFVTEVGNQHQIPGGSYINETTSGGAAAALAATPASVSTATAALTTAIQCAAAAVSVSTATASLVDNIIYANAASVSAATAALTTAIRLAATPASVSAATAALTTTAAVGFDTPVLKNNTGTVLSSETGVVVNVYNSTTGALVLRKTGLTSNGSGVVAVRDITAALVAATTYSYEVVLTSNGRRLPTATAS